MVAARMLNYKGSSMANGFTPRRRPSSHRTQTTPASNKLPSESNSTVNTMDSSLSDFHITGLTFLWFNHWHQLIHSARNKFTYYVPESRTFHYQKNYTIKCTFQARKALQIPKCSTAPWADTWHQLDARQKWGRPEIKPKPKESPERVVVAAKIASPPRRTC
jgi:hypothetical protein